MENKIQGTYEKLKQQYLDLYKESEDLYKENIHIYYEYIFIFGSSYHKRINLYYLCERKSKMLDILLDKLAINQEINISEIENDLDLYFSDLISKVNLLKNEFKQAKVFLNLPQMSTQDAQELVNLFKTITSYLHPSLRDHDDNLKKLWKKALNAYRNNDLKALRSCVDKICELGLELPIKKDNNIDYEKMIQKFKENIEILTSKNTYLINSFPYNQKELINSKDLIDKRLKEVEKDIELFKKRLDYLEEVIANFISSNKSSIC